MQQLGIKQKIEGELLSVPGHPAGWTLSHAEVTRHVMRGPNTFLNARKNSNKIRASDSYRLWAY